MTLFYIWLGGAIIYVMVLMIILNLEFNKQRKLPYGKLLTEIVCSCPVWFIGLALFIGMKIKSWRQ